MTHTESQAESEREAFEAAFADKLDFLRLSPVAEYLYSETGLAWDGWQARAALQPELTVGTPEGMRVYAKGYARSWKKGREDMGQSPVAAETVKECLTVPPGMVLVSISDLHAIDRAMQHMGDVLNEMDAVEEGDDDLAVPGFEAMERLIAAAPNHGASAAAFTAS